MGYHPKRLEIWEQIMKCEGEFTVSQIHKELSGISRNAVKNYLMGCVAAGIVKDVAPKVANISRKYVLVLPSENAPDLTVQGKEIVKGDKSQNYMWRGMKMLRRFTPRTLAINVSTAEVPVDEKASLKYCKALASAGYIVLIGEKHSLDSEYIFRSSQNTGQHAPKLVPMLVTGVFDQNRGKVQWPEKGQVV